MPKNEKPECLTEEHLRYLDILRESGVTNMFGAAPYLLEMYPEIGRKDARKVVAYWMLTFVERQKQAKERDRLEDATFAVRRRK